MHSSRFSIGIDLGTTHSCLAYVDAHAAPRSAPVSRILPIPQLVAPGLVESRDLLPSVLYFPAGPELPPGSTGLPWPAQQAEPRPVAGLLARALGARAPGRVVLSAKSWLCHPDVDRRAPILPWSSTDGTPKVSPLEAQALLLGHMRDAWNHQMGGGKGARMEEQEISLAVPASFDAVARQLTQEAAARAGLERVTLLEEPQVAFYCWLATHRKDWWAALGKASTILVCDVGGGTSDFTLIAVRAQGGDSGPEPVRVAVGDHLLLGGDNFDLALAHLLEPRLSPRQRLPAWEWGELVLACRDAKELLLGEGAPERTNVTVLGRSSRVVGGARRTPLSRQEVEEAVLDGFFPRCAPQDSPTTDRTGLRELGLPYVSDPAVTRHLASFLRVSREAMDQTLGESHAVHHEGPLARPDVVLFNGGVFHPRIVRDRLLDVIRAWFPRATDQGWVLDGISNDEPDLAVARGAAYYGLVRRGRGLRIGGGSARSYYIGLGARGHGGVARVCCVVPRGMEEGEQHVVEPDGGALKLVLGQAVRFPLYAASSRPKDAVGQVLPADSAGLVSMPGLRTMLEQPGAAAAPVDVDLVARLTLTGTLEIACEAPALGKRWELAFELRAADTRKDVVPSGSAPPSGPARGQQSTTLLAGAQGLVRTVFGPEPGTGLARDPVSLRKRLEEMLATSRERWNLHTLRLLLSALLESPRGRLASPEHEFAWLNLAGYCGRPGFGHPSDEQRLVALWSIYPEGVRHRREEMNFRAWWTMWRRVSAGLAPALQRHLYERVRPIVMGDPGIRRQLPPAADRPGVIEEAWRLVASLEHLGADEKVPLGDRLSQVLAARLATPWALWALARIGNRSPLTPGASSFVPPTQVARWITPLLVHLKRRNDSVTFCLAQIARRTGDRARDLDETLSADLRHRMESIGAPDRHIELVSRVVELAGTEQEALLGDALPPGLIHEADE